MAVTPVVANATNTVAMVPGALGSAWAYRAQLQGARRWLWILLGPSIVGGVIGTLLVIHYPDSFEALIPWLILGATLLFLVQPMLRWLRRDPSEAPPQSSWRITGVVLFQFMVAIYGGYFGAGIGILMLSVLGLLGLTHIHQMNVLKNLLGAAINASSCVVFILDGQVHWTYALVMAAACIVGGYLGARLAQKVPMVLVRRLVIVIGFALTLYFFLRGPGSE